MKRATLRIVVLLLLTFIFTFTFITLQTINCFAQQSYNVVIGTHRCITAWSVTKYVTNNSCPGAGIFVPVNTALEWQDFYTNPPACCAVIPCGFATTYSTADCYSYSWNTVANGTAAQMYVEGMYSRVSLIRFDLSSIPTGGNVHIISAVLSLYQTGYSRTYNAADPTNQAFTFSRNMASFNENTIYDGYTPNYTTTFPPPAATDYVTLYPTNRCCSALLSAGWDTFDVTPFVTSWITNGQPNYGFNISPYMVLPASNENQFRFATKESGTVPFLTITYDCQ